jgi:REP-associated tyrosine transposase
MDQSRFFNPYADIRHSENRLPHWQQNGATYFVTFRLADSIPSHVLGQWQDQREAWLRLHPEPWSLEIELEYHRRFSGKLEQWLDEGHGASLLRRHDCAEIVAETLRHFEGERVAMISFVVMPNHVHALFVQNPEWPLEKLMRSWKGFTARQINKLLERSGSFWQRDYFDRLIRNAEHFEHCVRYIRRNPGKANLGANDFVLWESQAALDVA